MVNKGQGALAGVAAAAVALGVGELVAVLTGPNTGPLIAVGGWIVDHVPEEGKQLAIDLFGTNDKLALGVGTVVILLAIAAGLGVAATRWFGVAAAGIGLFGLVGAAAAMSRPGAGQLALLPSVLGAIAGLITLRMLLNRAAEAGVDAVPTGPDSAPNGPALGRPAQAGAAGRARPAESMNTAGRRRFLWAGGLAAAGAGVVGVIGRSLQLRSDVGEARAAISLPLPADPAPALPAGIEDGFVTSNRDFYRIDTALITPQVDPDTWTLRIHGMVDREVTISYAELLAMPMVERHITIACVSNEVGGDLIGNARWLGVPIREVLRRAAPRAGADQVVSRSVDGWTCGTPTSVLLDDRDALLAVGMNGEPLPVDHGFPVRMVVPGLYGYVSACKWLAEWEVTTFAAFDAYWVPRGWSALGPIKTQSRIDTPRGGSKPAGDIMIGGVAWAQQRGIEKVEVRVDDGPWQEAELLNTVSVDTWRQWRLKWAAVPGRHRLTVRATDADGVTQTEQEAPPAPDGATGWHSVELQVR
jgi:DMSO/TMAO reductase YedYZ molybdopterin-dependent catalytic subunit